MDDKHFSTTGYLLFYKRFAGFTLKKVCIYKYI